MMQSSKFAKISLVDAVQKANQALTGQVVGAMLEAPGLETSGKDKTTAMYAVLVIHEGKVWSIGVDAQSGIVGKPRVAEDDDDDERGEAHGADKKPAADLNPGKEAGVQNAKLDFEDTPTGSPPSGWRAVETAGDGKLAKWAVEERADAAGGKRVLSLVETRNSGSTFNLVLSDAVFPANLTLSVKIYANTGGEDQGGGLVWRGKDAGNYYLARWNPLEDNLRCYKVVGDRRTMFESADVRADAKAWHEIAVTMQGSKGTIILDGKALLAFTDDTFPNAGRVGVWTKADAASSFDDLEVHSK